jgi:hypothetical protein
VYLGHAAAEDTTATVPGPTAVQEA